MKLQAIESASMWVKHGRGVGTRFIASGAGLPAITRKDAESAIVNLDEQKDRTYSYAGLSANLHSRK